MVVHGHFWTSGSSGGSRNLERGVQPPAREARWKFWVATPTFGDVNAFIQNIAGRPNRGVRHKRNLVHCPTVLF